MWDLMYPKGYKPKSHGHHSSSSGSKRCAACRTRIGIAKLLNGQRVNLKYCEKHYCKMPTSVGTICTAQNNGRTQFCDQHIRCHDTGDEGRCWRFVKEENPMQFKYCKDHSCASAACSTRRTDTSSPHCAAHRCGDPCCDKPKQLNTGSLYCERHTCLAANCTALVPSGDAAGAVAAATRFCDLHRTCAAPACTRRCHTRDNMISTRWCGAHYCTATDSCDEKRAEGNDRFCREHICLDPGCHGGKKVQPLTPTPSAGGSGGGSGLLSLFCAEHTCKADGCMVRRERGAEHCGAHMCRVEDCVKPAAGPDRRCDVHRRCTVEGCKEWIYIEHGPEGDIRWPECENHHRPRCAAITLANTPCDKRIPIQPTTSPGAGPARYCPDHSCSFHACPNARPFESLQFCNAHKCGVATCQDHVKNAMPPGFGDSSLSLLQQTRLLLAAASGIGGGGVGVSGAGGSGAGPLSGLLGMNGKFCAAHSCLGDGGKCGAEVVGAEEEDRAGLGRRGRRRGDEAKRFCQKHECGHRGCCAEATHQNRRNSRGGMCDRHYRWRRRDVGGGAGNMGPGPFGGFGMPPPMGMMAGFPPYFGDAGGYESSDESSDAEDGMGYRGLPFGGPFF